MQIPRAHQAALALITSLAFIPTASARTSRVREFLQHAQSLTMTPTHYVVLGIVLAIIAIIQLRRESKELLALGFGMIALGCFVAAGVMASPQLSEGVTMPGKLNVMPVRGL